MDAMQESLCEENKSDGSIDNNLIGDRSIDDNLIGDNTISDSFLERAIVTHLSSGDDESDGKIEEKNIQEEILEDEENIRNMTNQKVRF